MLQIQKNSRQIPKEEKMTSNEKYNDLLYGYLQSISYPAESGLRIVRKNDATFTKIGKKLHKDRATISKYFKQLQELGLIEESEEYKKYYVLISIEKTLAMLVSENTLRELCNTLQDRCISVYVYLLNRYYACRERNFDVLMDTLKKFVGLSINTTSNNVIITDILNVLVRLQLLSYTHNYDEEGKCHISILKVKNQLPELLV